MPDINKPMAVPELNLRPPIDGKVRLSEDMQQTLALLTAFSENKRVTLKASESGVLNVTSARIKDIIHCVATVPNCAITGPNVTCSEVMLMAHPDNTGLVWVRPDVPALANNAWPLAAGEVVNFSVGNLNQINALVIVNGETVIAAYTR